MIIDKSKLDLALARACLNQRNLREKGISGHTMFRISKGENMRPSTVGRIALAIGVDVADLIEREV